jgi:hypothetical protein
VPWPLYRSGRPDLYTGDGSTDTLFSVVHVQLFAATAVQYAEEVVATCLRASHVSALDFCTGQGAGRPVQTSAPATPQPRRATPARVGPVLAHRLLQGCLLGQLVRRAATPLAALGSSGPPLFWVGPVLAPRLLHGRHHGNLGSPSGSLFRTHRMRMVHCTHDRIDQIFLPHVILVSCFFPTLPRALLATAAQHRSAPAPRNVT